MAVAVEVFVDSFSGDGIFLRDANIEGFGAEGTCQSGNYGVSYHEI